ncbi:hypothetical protein [Ornithobacterium rhinotracheale]|uniref:hypothetical protein n=1 Tax=Ornithobacterium rhinotracheale TaxID=28251 RepID=UPI001FF64AB0|nr:hypothetical protein [Ornithobacterium rhinotracheale]MCK0201339.1 hypothetical protein [Ornithobacterium rhinotracheale]
MTYEVEVDVDLDDFPTDEILTELYNRTRYKSDCELINKWLKKIHNNLYYGMPEYEEITTYEQMKLDLLKQIKDNLNNVSISDLEALANK